MCFRLFISQVSSKVVAPTDAPINLVSNLVERIDLRIRTLGAWVESVETAKHSRIRAMKRRSTFEYLKEERLQEAEKECQQVRRNTFLNAEEF